MSVYIKARHLKVGDKLINRYFGVENVIGEVVEVVKEMRQNAGVYVYRRQDGRQYVIVKLADGSKKEYAGLEEIRIQEREEGNK
jgi:hypothetical protein